MNLDVRLARRVGAASLAVLGAAIVFFVFAYGQLSWGKHVRVHVYFHTTGGLHEGAAFVVAGQDVGRVEAIALSPRGAPGPLAGDAGVVVTVAIDAGVARRLGRGGDVFVASRGVLSDKYLELGPAPPGASPLADGDQILGRDPPSLDRVLQRTFANLTTLSAFTDDLRPELDALRARLTELRDTVAQLAPGVPLRADLDALIAEADRTYDALGDGPGLLRLGVLAADARVMLGHARTDLGALGGDADALGSAVGGVRAHLAAQGASLVARVQLAIDRARAALAAVDPLLAQVAAIRAQLERGDGSLMKLMNDPEFPEDAKELGKILKRHPWRIIGRPRDH